MTFIDFSLCYIFLFCWVSVEAGSCANFGDLGFEKNMPANKPEMLGSEGTPAEGSKVQTVCCSQLILCRVGQGLTAHMNYSLCNKLHHLNKENRIIWKRGYYFYHPNSQCL